MFDAIVTGLGGLTSGATFLFTQGWQNAVMLLVAGVLLGPSVFGMLWPDAQRAIFAGGPEQKAMLDAVSDLGILMLLLLTGMETDLRLVKRTGRAAASTASRPVLAAVIRKREAHALDRRATSVGRRHPLPAAMVVVELIARTDGPIAPVGVLDLVDTVVVGIANVDLFATIR